jgi:hypothetical protein
MAQSDLATLSNGTRLGTVSCRLPSRGVHTPLDSEIPANGRHCDNGAGTIAAGPLNGRPQKGRQ